MTRRPELVRELTIAGAGAVVLPSLLEEQIVRELIQEGAQPSSEEHQVQASGSPHLEDIYNGGVKDYLRTLGLLKQCTGIPIIASLNGCPHGSWLSYVSRLEAAGADAVELSIQSSLNDPNRHSEAVEDSIVRAVDRVCRSVSIPVSIKLLPFITSLPSLVSRLATAGAKGVVLFGREPIWEVFDGTLTASCRWSLSDAGQLQTTLSGLMRARPGADHLSVAASGGISTAKDVIHCVIAGADIAMVSSELYRTGPDVVAHILEGITRYLERQGMRSFDSFVERCRAAPDGNGSRRSRVRAMLDTDHYRDPHPEPAPQSGDPWGHVYPTPVDD
jgi:dihydroorotate dehydrogenase (fumarate)